MIGSSRSTCHASRIAFFFSDVCRHKEAPEVDSDDDMGFRMHLEARISKATGC